MKENIPDQNQGKASVTSELREWGSGDRESMGHVLEELYSELHRIAAGLLTSERVGHTLQPTALVSELYLRLQASAPPALSGRTHFLAVVATTFKRILIDYARTRRAERRGGDKTKVNIDLLDIGVPCTCEDLLIIDEALTRLQEADGRAARVTELRFFMGLQEDEIAQELGISEITVKRDWKFARAWLVSYLDNQSPDGR